MDGIRKSRNCNLEIINPKRFSFLEYSLEVCIENLMKHFLLLGYIILKILIFNQIYH